MMPSHSDLAKYISIPKVVRLSLLPQNSLRFDIVDFNPKSGSIKLPFWLPNHFEFRYFNPKSGSIKFLLNLLNEPTHLHISIPKVVRLSSFAPINDLSSKVISIPKVVRLSWYITVIAIVFLIDFNPKSGSIKFFLEQEDENDESEFQSQKWFD